MFLTLYLESVYNTYNTIQYGSPWILSNIESNYGITAKNMKIINGPVVQHAERSVAPLEKYTKIFAGPVC